MRRRAPWMHLALEALARLRRASSPRPLLPVLARVFRASRASPPARVLLLRTVRAPTRGSPLGVPRRPGDDGRRARRPRATPLRRSLRRRRHTARATVPGDSGVANPGLDAATLAIRGDGVEGSDPGGTLVERRPRPRTGRRGASRIPPLVTDYDLEEEVKPRINYLRFLSDNDRLGGETVASASSASRRLERRFGVVHEDAEYVVVDKPWCVRLDTPARLAREGPVHPEVPRRRVVRGLARAQAHPDWDPVRFCHQLDNATSGVLVAASNKRAAAAVAKLFSERRAKKTYLAIVFGHPERDEWRVTAAMGRDPDDPKGFESGSRRRGRTGRRARLARVFSRGPWRAADVAREVSRRAVAKVEVHARDGAAASNPRAPAHSGHPIVGDNAYSAKTGLVPDVSARARARDAVPEPRGTDTFEAPDPESFAAAVVADDACARKEP